MSERREPGKPINWSGRRDPNFPPDLIPAFESVQGVECTLMPVIHNFKLEPIPAFFIKEPGVDNDPWLHTVAVETKAGTHNYWVMQTSTETVDMSKFTGNLLMFYMADLNS